MYACPYSCGPPYGEQDLICAYIEVTLPLLQAGIAVQAPELLEMAAALLESITSNIRPRFILSLPRLPDQIVERVQRANARGKNEEKD